MLCWDSSCRGPSPGIPSADTLFWLKHAPTSAAGTAADSQGEVLLSLPGSVRLDLAQKTRAEGYCDSLGIS